MKKAFTLIELIFAIVIIGVLISVAIPKFTGLTKNAKISSELSTASSVQTAIDACHGEWIVNEGDFRCGVDINSSDFTDEGYPKNSALGSPLDRILKNGSQIDWSATDNSYEGPATKNGSGVSCKGDKPCSTKHWDYNETKGTFTLTDD